MSGLYNHAQGRTIALKDIVEGEQYSAAFMEKIMQDLRRANIINSHQGNHGGYALARPADKITLKEIIEALEGQTFEVFCEPESRENIVCNHFSLCGMKPVWFKTKEVLDHFFSTITLEMVAQHRYPETRFLPEKEAV